MTSEAVHRECFLREDDKDAALEAFQTADKQNAELKSGAIEAFIEAAGPKSEGVTSALSPSVR